MITINDNCINLIKSFEGLRLNPYHGAADRPDVFTIGYGTIKYPPDYLRGKHVALSDPKITEEMALHFLKWEVSKLANSIDILLIDNLTPNQYGAIISFGYNLGYGSVKDSTLRKKINIKPNDPTIRNEFMKWVHSNGKIVEGLKRRRKAEADLYFS